MSYSLMCERARIWANIVSKSFMHKIGSKDFVFDLHKFVLFHLMKNLPFDFPHTIFINILRTLKPLGSMEDIYYAALINKLHWEYDFYHVFDKMDEESKHMIIVKGFIIAKQQQFRKINLIKAIKLELKLDQREPLQVDEEATKRCRQMKLSNITVDEDKALQTFGIANRIDKIMQEHANRKKQRNRFNKLKQKKSS